MKGILICPSDRDLFPCFTRKRPIALVPIMGRTWIDWMLSFLADKGAKEIIILSSDRPDQIRNAVGLGEKWGLKITVIPEMKELSAEEAVTKYQGQNSGSWMPKPYDVTVLNHLPNYPDVDILHKPAEWFCFLKNLIQKGPLNSILMRENSPGIWIGMKSQIHPSARLNPPVWIGNHSYISKNAIIGPGTILEDEVYVDEGAEIAESYVGQSTYVGKFIELKNTLAWASGLLNWKNGSFTEVTDEFLLSDLCPHEHGRFRSSIPGRLAAVLAVVLTSPLLILAVLRHKSHTGSIFQNKMAVYPGVNPQIGLTRTIEYRELPDMKGILKRWPQLLNIIQGNFCWIGNRPLSIDEARELKTDFERMWLQAPIGLFSLADAMGCKEPFGEEARIHASFYAAQRGGKQDWAILRCLIKQLFGMSSHPNI